MTAQQPIPLRADPAALRQAERRSLVRACAALVLGNKPGVHPERIIKTWGDDAMAAAILKVAQSPTSTATYPQPWPAGSRCVFSTTPLPRWGISPASMKALPIRLFARVLPIGGAAQPKRPAGSRRCALSTRLPPEIIEQKSRAH